MVNDTHTRRRRMAFKVIKTGTNQQPVCDLLLVADSWMNIKFEFEI